MKLTQLLEGHSDELGTGVSLNAINDLQAKLNVELPAEFIDFLLKFNYAEIYSEPIYCIDPQIAEIDILTQNMNKEHFKNGFLELFVNDIDGTIYIRHDTGAVYNATFEAPIAQSFTQFVEAVLK
ncbi:MAG: SMI1/KNR4 family protein [Alteromonadales bacterium]|nr:SMI1/KNR4 family protein [Alteromonadales bacterium]